MSTLADSMATAIDPIVHADQPLVHTTGLSVAVSGTARVIGQAWRLATRVVQLDCGRIDSDLPIADFVRAAVQGRPASSPLGEHSWSRR